ncbi:putative ribonuclease H-like domain-containing protein [Tanacetum coccineum]
MADQDTPPPTITAMKIPIIKKGEYDIWSMRMRQYICHTDHNLWDIIVNGDLEDEATPSGEQSSPPVPKNAKQLAARRNQERIKSILLLAIPDEYLLKFHNVPDAKSLWAAIKSRFRVLLVRDFWALVTARLEFNQVPSTPSAHDIAYSFLAQPITSPQLENKDFQQMDGDDLEELDLRWQVAMLTVRIECYNCHRKGPFARECRSGKSQGRRPYGDYDWSNDFEVEPVNYALMAISCSSSSSSSDSEIALESLEARIIGHEKNELAWGERYEFQNYDLKCREIKINNLNLELEKVVKERDELKLKIEKWEGSSKNLTKILNNEYDFRNKIIESIVKPKSVNETVVSKLKINRNEVIIEDWTSDDEDDVCDVKTVSSIKPNVTQAVRSQVNKSGQTSQKQGIDFKKAIGLTIAQSNSVIRPYHPRLDIVRPKASNSPIKRSYFTQLVYRPKDLKPYVKTFRVNNMTTFGTRAVVSKGKVENVLKKAKWGNPEILLQDHAVVDSGCSSHMTGNKAYLSDYEIVHNGNALWLFGNELKFNLFSVSQMCDKKNSVLFTESECLILSPSFKLLDESQVVLRAPRKDDVYNLDLKNIVPSGGHQVRGLPSKVFVNDHTCVAYKKGKQHKASCKAKLDRIIRKPLELLHMDLFRPVSIESINKKRCDNGTEFKNYVMNELCAKKRNHREDIQDSEDVFDKEGQHQMPEDEQVWQDELEMMVTQELVTNAMNDESRQAFKEEKRRINLKSEGQLKLPVAKAEESFICLFLEEKYLLMHLLFLMLIFPIDPNMPDLEDASDTLPNDGIFNGAYNDDKDMGAVADFHNLDNTIVDFNNEGKIQKDSLVTTSLYNAENCFLLSFKLRAQGHRQEEGIDYDEVFAPVARIEAIRLFLAFASYMGFLVYQMDVKSVYIKLLEAWYGDTLFILLENGFRDGHHRQTLFIHNYEDFNGGFVAFGNDPKGDGVETLVDGVEVDVHEYRSMIGSLMYLTASRPDIMFVVCACARDSSFKLEAFSDSDYAGASLDRKSTTGGCQFLGRRLISWQCKKQIIVANYTTEAEYVATAHCCGQVLWIQNQMMDYGFNFMNTKIHIDNESTICVVKNLVYHSRTKHIEIRHPFIRDCYAKRLIDVLKIHTDSNVADLLTKGFDVTRNVKSVVTFEGRISMDLRMDRSSPGKYNSAMGNSGSLYVNTSSLYVNSGRLY